MQRLILPLLLASCPVWTAAATTVAPERLVEHARSYLQALPAPIPGELVLDAMVPEASEIEADPASITLDTGRIAGQWPRGRVGVPVRILVRDQLRQTRMVWFSVKWWADVPAYAARYAEGTARETVAVRIARVDIADLSVRGSTLLTSDAAHLRLRREVQAGQPMLASDFEPLRTIERRDNVMLSLTQGRVVVRMPATAMGAGQAGDVIAVVPAGAREPIKARVASHGEVIVER